MGGGGVRSEETGQLAGQTRGTKGNGRNERHRQLLCYYLVRIFWWPANSNECRFGYHCQQQASNCCNLQRGSRNKLISHLLYNFILNPLMAAVSNPFRRGSRGWGDFIHQKPWHWKGKWLHHGGDVCVLVFS